MDLSKTKKQKTAAAQTKTRTSLLEKTRSVWSQIRPVFFFVSFFALLMFLFYVIWMSKFSSTHIQGVIASVNASLSKTILNILGQQVTSSGDIITSTALTISIRRGCDAIEAMAMFASCVIAFPAKWKKKLTGLFTGIIILFVLNQIRIVSLFFTGVYFPQAMELMHVEIWQVVFIFISIGLFIFWIRWSNLKKPDAKQ